MTAGPARAMAVAGALVIAALLSACRESPPPASAPSIEENPPGWPKLYHPAVDPRIRELFGHLRFTVPQRLAFWEAGLAAMEGRKPSEALSPASLDLVREMAALMSGVECADGDQVCRTLRPDLLACLDDAATILLWRRSRPGSVSKELHRAAIGAAVIARDREFQTAPAIVDRCRKLAIARERFPPMA